MTVSPGFSLAPDQSVTTSAYSPSGLIKRGVERLRVAYYRYEVTYGVYVMTPGEKFITNGFVLIVISLLTWAFLLYFPSLIYQKLGRLDWLLTGRNEGQMSRALSLVNASCAPVSFGKVSRLHS